MAATLYYAHDPMCSWCWAFHPLWQQIKAGLPEDVRPRLLMGGLAPDSDVPMPEPMQQHLQGIWRTIASHVPGTEFNMEFWTRCQPRRSTFPACRAVLAAEAQRPGSADDMSLAIQQAYYLQARNPSDDSTLCELAAEIKLDSQQFAEALNSQAIRTEHEQQLSRCMELGVQGYPSLVYKDGPRSTPVPVDYHSAETTLAQLRRTHSA